ncbi:hypothetical protein [Enterococcus hailinensis]|uniref:hypothetical protein n=1 Tax=Enterococcus hailinensis TaxID=3238988 RepID=UPI0038B2E316
MFWNKKENPFVVRQDFNYPKVLIKTPHKDIEGYIEEVDFDYLDERSKAFIVHAEREHPITRERIGTAPNDKYLDKKIIGHKRDM